MEALRPQKKSISCQKLNPIQQKNQYYNQSNVNKNVMGIFQLLDQDLIVKIFQYLNLIDLFGIIYQINKRFKNILENDPNILYCVNLTSMPIISIQQVNKLLNGKKLVRQFYVSEKYQIQDIQLFLSLIIENLEKLYFNGMNFDFNSVLNFKLKDIKVKNLALENVTLRKKNLDENEIKIIIESFKNIEQLKLNCYCFDQFTLKQLLKNFNQIQRLELTQCQLIDNQLFQHIIQLDNLKQLLLIAYPNNYNTKINYDGFQHIKNSKFQLEYIRIEYFTGIGDKTLQLLGKKFKNSLKELHIIRNCFVKCASISENSFKELSECSKMERISLVYSRKLRTGIGSLLLKNLHNLIEINIKDCCIQEDLQMLGENCPHLRELDLSGDSWVHESTLLGISKHPNLKIFKMGHFQHSDQNCSKNIKENPSKGLFIEAIFKKKDLNNFYVNFKSLDTLFLEKSCSLTYWLDIRLLNIRNNLTIKYQTHQNIFQTS